MNNFWILLTGGWVAFDDHQYRYMAAAASLTAATNQCEQMEGMLWTMKGSDVKAVLQNFVCGSVCYKSEY